MDNEKNTANGGENTGRTFTQEEVNQIVSGRLKEEREKMKREQDAAFAEREQNIKAREMRMNVLDKLKSKGLPESLADAINCSDEKSVDKSIEILTNTYKAEQGEYQKSAYHPAGGTGEKPDPIRAAMGLSQ
jgi:5-methylcytosine-specific restriction endonuclease McrBC regulatory subunit McrC|nr:MAG TPA: Major head protein [Bacteriophage sp.]